MWEEFKILGNLAENLEISRFYFTNFRSSNHNFSSLHSYAYDQFNSTFKSIFIDNRKKL